jgi:hypothetical protein
MLAVLLFAATIEYQAPAPVINPEICHSIRRMTGGYLVTKEVWPLVKMRLRPGDRLIRGRQFFAGRDFVNLIEATCSPASS